MFSLAADTTPLHCIDWGLLGIYITRSPHEDQPLFLGFVSPDVILGAGMV